MREKVGVQPWIGFAPITRLIFHTNELYWFFFKALFLERPTGFALVSSGLLGTGFSQISNMINSLKTLMKKTNRLSCRIVFSKVCAKRN